MKRAVSLVALVALLGVGWVVASAEQDVRPIIPRGQQRVEAIGPRREQVVQGIGAPAEQQVERYVEPSKTAKAVSNAGKVVTGVTAAAVSIGAMTAMLLLL